MRHPDAPRAQSECTCTKVLIIRMYWIAYELLSVHKVNGRFSRSGARVFSSHELSIQQEGCAMSMCQSERKIQPTESFYYKEGGAIRSS